MPKKKPNKFLKINDKVISLPKPALGQKKSPKPLYGNTYPNGRVLGVDPFKERRDDCADFEGQIISREDFMDKYKIGSNRHWEWQYEGKDGYTRVRKFCQFYK